MRMMRYVLSAPANRSTISPGMACRPTFDFSKIGTPSWDTSKRPPDDGTISISA